MAANNGQSVPIGNFDRGRPAPAAGALARLLALMRAHAAESRDPTAVLAQIKAIEGTLAAALPPAEAQPALLATLRALVDLARPGTALAETVDNAIDLVGRHWPG